MVKVGDIVRTKNKEGKVVIPGVITKVNTSRNFYGEVELVNIEVLFADGTYGWRAAKKFTETGRHIDMQSVLDSIR